MKAFPIEFVAQTIRQTLLELHLANPSVCYGGDDQIAIHSFYEQLQSQEQVDRFVETYKDLADQQNRTGLIGNGIIVSSENPSITNIRKDRYVIPMSWTLVLRCTLEDRDNMVDTLNALITQLKGRKRDIAALDTGEVFMVGTRGNHNNTSANVFLKGDYIGLVNSTGNIDTQVKTIIGVAPYPDYVYAEDDGSEYGKLVTIVKNSLGNYAITEDDGYYPDIIFAPKNEYFTKWKLSMSFDAIRCDEPYTLNGTEYVELSLGGSATLVSNGIKLGNDLIAVEIQKYKIKAESEITFTNATTYTLDPIEMPSGNSANTQISQVVSNAFKTNTHTDSIALTLQYTCILDETNLFLKQLFNYGRYGTYGTTVNDICPNMIYKVTEVYSSWGVWEQKIFYGKIIESIDIQNTESDTMTIGFTLQIQGDN